MRKSSKKPKMSSGIRMKGFFRGLIKDKDGRIVGDTGLIENTATQSGLINVANLIAGTTTNRPVVSAQIGTSFNSASTVLGGSASNKAISPSTSGVCTATFAVTFAGSDTSLAAMGAAGLIAANSSLMAGQTFTASDLASNQTFELTYQIRFATA